MAINTNLSVIKYKWLNAPIKTHRVDEWIKKHDSSIQSLQQTHFKLKDTFRQKVKRWKKTFYANRNKKKTGVPLLLSDKQTLKEKTVKI